MTDSELQQQRKAKWRVDGNAVRTLEDARAFLEDVGMCLVYPVRPALPLPTWIGAFTGSEERLPDARHAFSDPRALEAEELMLRLLREKSAFESNLLGQSNLLVAASLFPYFHALVTAQEKKGTSKGDKLSPLAADAFKVIQQKGPVGKQQLRTLLKGDLSISALDRALAELWARLKITRVGHDPHEGAVWDTFARWAPKETKQGVSLSTVEALSAMLSKYLDAAVAAEPAEVEAVLAHLAPRSRIKEAVNALLSARELSFVHIGQRTLIQITPARTDTRPRAKRGA
ncbi:MAG: winged helix DNA-binding domain-containing protein [Acidobacteriota bacterium]|nr:winged helix DNA-binding domain-containing protein [Acidobacteriota bacterium]